MLLFEHLPTQHTNGRQHYKAQYLLKIVFSLTNLCWPGVRRMSPFHISSLRAVTQLFPVMGRQYLYSLHSTLFTLQITQLRITYYKFIPHNLLPIF